MKSVQLLLERGANPDTPVAVEATQTTPLFFAVRMRDQPEFMQLLIEYGANVNHQSRFGETPLTMAIFASCYVNARLLLDAGADPLLEHERGECH